MLGCCSIQYKHSTLGFLMFLQDCLTTPISLKWRVRMLYLEDPGIWYVSYGDSALSIEVLMLSVTHKACSISPKP